MYRNTFSLRASCGKWSSRRAILARGMQFDAELAGFIYLAPNMIPRQYSVASSTVTAAWHGPRDITSNLFGGGLFGPYQVGAVRHY
jgi:hypothetical protein